MISFVQTSTIPSKTERKKKKKKKKVTVMMPNISSALLRYKPNQNVCRSRSGSRSCCCRHPAQQTSCSTDWRQGFQGISAQLTALLISVQVSSNQSTAIAQIARSTKKKKRWLTLLPRKRVHSLSVELLNAFVCICPGSRNLGENRIALERIPAHEPTDTLATAGRKR